jgi:hypothetical protein
MQNFIGQLFLDVYKMNLNINSGIQFKRKERQRGLENGIKKNNIQKVQVIFLPSAATPTQQSSVAYK